MFKNNSTVVNAGGKSDVKKKTKKYLSSRYKAKIKMTAEKTAVVQSDVFCFHSQKTTALSAPRLSESNLSFLKSV